MENLHGFHTSLNPWYKTLREGLLADLIDGKRLPEEILAQQFNRYCY